MGVPLASSGFRLGGVEFSAGSDQFSLDLRLETAWCDTLSARAISDTDAAPDSYASRAARHDSVGAGMDHRRKLLCDIMRRQLGIDGDATICGS